MHCISINYRKTPLYMRALFSFTSREKESFEGEVTSITGKGCVVVSTCNRTEVYFTGEKETIHQIEKIIARIKKVPYDKLKEYVLIYSEEGAIRHLCQVASGMESMVIGEDEILRQVKEAYQVSLNNHRTDSGLNIIFQGAIGTAKAVKTDTKLSTTPVSVGTLTVNEIVKFLPNREGNVLLIGLLGKMGSIVAKNLLAKEGIRIVGTSRTRGNICNENTFNCNIFNESMSNESISNGNICNENTSNEISSNEISPNEITSSGTESHESIINSSVYITVIPYEERYRYIGWADVIVSATTSPHYTIRKEEVESLLIKVKKNRLWIDLAVPSDIDQEIKELDQVRLLDIDDFNVLSKQNNEVKHQEIEKANILIDYRVEEIRKTLSVNRLREKLGDLDQLVQEKGIAHLLYKLKDTMAADEIEQLTRGLLHFIEEEKE